MLTIIRLVTVFIIATCVDVLWVFYIKTIGDKKALPAANYGTLLYASSAFITLSWVDNRWMIIPSLLGAYIGTYYAVRYLKLSYIRKKNLERYLLKIRKQKHVKIRSTHKQSCSG